MPPPKGAILNTIGGEVYAPSVANAVRYAYGQAVPIIVTEHGVSTPNDSIRARLIAAALPALLAVAKGVPVHGYCHRSLFDNYEWISGYKRQLGLVAVDRTTFTRTSKPSAYVCGAIVRRNAV